MTENRYTKTHRQLHGLEAQGTLARPVKYASVEEAMDTVAALAIRLVHGDDEANEWRREYRDWEARQSSQPPEERGWPYFHHRYHSLDPFGHDRDCIANVERELGTVDIDAPRATVARYVRTIYTDTVLMAFRQLRCDLESGGMTVGRMWDYVGSFAVLLAYGKRRYDDTPVGDFSRGTSRLPTSWPQTLSYLASMEPCLTAHAS